MYLSKFYMISEKVKIEPSSKPFIGNGSFKANYLLTKVIHIIRQ